MGNFDIIRQKIRHYRWIKDMMQKELAARLVFASMYIANIEKNQKGISLEKSMSFVSFFTLAHLIFTFIKFR